MKQSIQMADGSIAKIGAKGGSAAIFEPGSYRAMNAVNEDNPAAAGGAAAGSWTWSGPNTAILYGGPGPPKKQKAPGRPPKNKILK